MAEFEADAETSENVGIHENCMVSEFENQDCSNTVPDARTMNSSVLAYVGDAVYELYVRKHVVENGDRKPDLLNKQAVRYVRAESQALAAKAIADLLDEDEAAVFRRSKNKKITSMPKNISPAVYKLATALEGLIGYLYLAGKTDRMEELIYKVIEIIESEGEGKIIRGN